MKITSNIEEFTKQFEKYKLEVQRKLKRMVELFSINIVITAINQTPYGTMSSLYDVPERADYGLEPFPGHAKGGWIVSLSSIDTNSLGERADSKGDDSALNFAETKLRTYVLGEEIFVVNNVPYVSSKGFTTPYQGSLEGGYSKDAPAGISAPTLDAIMSIYQFNLAEYYKDS